MQVLEINNSARVDLNCASWRIAYCNRLPCIKITGANGIPYTFFNSWSDDPLVQTDNSRRHASTQDIEDVFAALDELIRPKVMTAFWITKADVIEKAREIKAKRELQSADMVNFKDLAPGTVG